MAIEAPQFIWRQLFKVADKMREGVGRDSSAQFANLTYNQLRMIKIVYQLNLEFTDGVTLKMLAESLEITPAAASEMVDALVRKDVLKRDHNPQDRRAVAIKLSDYSRKLFQGYELRFNSLTDGFFNTLPLEKQAVFLEVLGGFDHWVEHKIEE